MCKNKFQKGFEPSTYRFVGQRGTAGQSDINRPFDLYCAIYGYKRKHLTSLQ